MKYIHSNEQLIVPEGGKCWFPYPVGGGLREAEVKFEAGLENRVRRRATADQALSHSQGHHQVETCHSYRS